MAAVYTSSIAVSYGVVASDGYRVVASTAVNFSGTIFSSTTPNGSLAALAPQGLAGNTTYYMKAGAVWGDFVSYNATVLATATLANVPGIFSPPFSAISTAAMAVNWTANGNPVGQSGIVVTAAGNSSHEKRSRRVAARRGRHSQPGETSRAIERARCVSWVWALPS